MIPRKELGSLRLKVQCHEERILDTQFYTPFVEFMLNVVDDKRVCNNGSEGVGFKIKEKKLLIC